MKKFIALLLAAVMLMAVFAACGEKAPDNPADPSLGTVDPDGQTPDGMTPGTPDDGEGDKEAAESVVTGDAVIPPTTPDTTTPGTTTPGTTTPGTTTPGTTTPGTTTPGTTTPGTTTPGTTTPGTTTPGTTTPGTTTPGTTNPAVSGDRSNVLPLKPMSTSNDINIFIWGDSIINVHSIEDTVRQMALNDGFNIDFRYAVSNNYGASSAYQLYELFNWDGADASSKITGWKTTGGGAKMHGSLTDGDKTVDYLIICTGRDRVITNPVTAARTITAMKYIYDCMKENRPNCTLVLYEPPAYEKYGALSQRINLSVKTDKEHNALIKAYSKQVSEALGGDHLTIAAGDAFEYFRANYANTNINIYDDSGDYPSDAGSYYIAAVMYGTIFNKTTAGMTASGLIDLPSAKILQNAAHKFVFGTEPTAVSHSGKPEETFVFEQVDPRTQTLRDPRFAGEKYPQYFDEFWAAVYSYCTRGEAIQYDKTALAHNWSSSTFWRRQYTRAPEFSSTQQNMYLDCSGFADVLYNRNFGYDIPGIDTSGMINVTEGRVFWWDGSAPEVSADSAAEKLIEVLEPGDVIIQRVSTGGHVMIYVGNGWIAHCTNTHAGGDSNDYNYNVKNDSHEPFGGMTFDKIDVVTNPAGAYYTFTSSYRVNVIRPFDLGIKPTAEGTTRAKNLMGVITWKESSVFEQGGTAGTGSDVTFTYVFRNDTKSAKTVSLQDKLPAGMTYKSGDVSFTNGSLSTSINVPANSTVRVSYTATVTAASGTVIPCADTLIGGLPSSGTPVYVKNTLADNGKAITAAASGVSASSDLEYIKAVYKKAYGIDLSWTTKEQLVNDTFKGRNENELSSISNPVMVNPYTFGGVAIKDMRELESYRIRNLQIRNLIAGDVIAVMTDSNTCNLLFYIGDGQLATFESGSLKILPGANTVSKLMSVLGEYAFVVLRPSIGF